MTKVYTTTEIRPNYTKGELKRAEWMEIKSAMLYEKSLYNKNVLLLGLQKYPKKGKCHYTVNYMLVGEISEKFMKNGMSASMADELVGNVILGIVNKKKPFLDGLCAWD